MYTQFLGVLWFLILPWFTGALLSNILSYKCEDFLKRIVTAYILGLSGNLLWIEFTNLISPSLFPLNSPKSILLGLIIELCFLGYFFGHFKILFPGKISKVHLTVAKILSLILILFIFTSALLISFYENDTLEYIGVAHRLYSSGSLWEYPINKATWLNPLYANSVHPTYFHVLLMYLYPQGFTSLFFRVSTIIFFTVILLVLRVRLHTSRTLFLLISCPIFLSSFIGHQIDTFRIAFFVVGLEFVLNALENYNPFLLAVGIGLIVMPHSTGLLLAVLVFISILMSTSKTNKKWVFQNLHIVVFSMSLYGIQYVINTLKLGTPVADSSPVQLMKVLEFDRGINLMRRIDSIFGKIFFGWLGPFTNLRIFGPIFVIAAFCSIILLKRLKGKQLDLRLKINLFIFLGYFVVGLLTLLLDANLVIKNSRYALTVLPQAIILGGYLLSSKESKN